MKNKKVSLSEKSELFNNSSNLYHYKDYTSPGTQFDFTSYPYKQNQSIMDNKEIEDFIKNVQSKPEVYITKSKNRVKNHSGVIYLQDGDNFEIELYNPTLINFGIKFLLNGQYISNSHLIIKPAQRIFLDRYLDTNNKFVYETYEVKNTKQNQLAIENNGKIKIEFYIEKLPDIFKSYPMVTPNSFPPSAPFDTFVYYSANINSSNDIITANTCCFDSLETGQVGKGEKSNTNFEDAVMNFDYKVYYDFSFHIKPLSQKPYETKDLIKHCVKCNKKAKKEDKFCSICGTSLDIKNKYKTLQYNSFKITQINSKEVLIESKIYGNFKIELNKLIDIVKSINMDLNSIEQAIKDIKYFWI